MLTKVQILQFRNHQCIIDLKDVIETLNFLFIVLELAEGQELFDKIIENTKLNKARLNFFQNASAIKYLHFKKICHRDLMPENMLLCSKQVTAHCEDHGQNRKRRKVAKVPNL